jgi:L-alanine-DL-glutamate epimerase-like enolase superfamily enzyme
MSSVHRESTASPAFARLAKVEAHVLRWPVRVPVRTSFGTMHDRPAVLVRVEDVDGAHGWGEAWCNFPSCGAEHRARLVESVLAPLLLEQAFLSPQAAFDAMTERTAVLALQSGEPGPLAQAIAGVDIALHDLAARRAGLPLWRALGAADGAPGAAEVASGSAAAPCVPVYASGINPDGAADTVARLRAAGHTGFKLKVGFGAERDLANLRDARTAAGAEALLMADANQAWDLDSALAMSARLADAGSPGWKNRCAPIGRCTSGSGSPPPPRWRWPRARTRSVTTPSPP